MSPAWLSWSGATGASVDYFRNTTKYTTANDGSHDDGPLNAGTYTYKVCLSGTSTCSGTISITYRFSKPGRDQCSITFQTAGADSTPCALGTA